MYPTGIQKYILSKHFEAFRFVYNHLLNIREEIYDKFGTTLTKKQFCKYMTILKHTHFPWSEDVNSQAVQAVRDELLSVFKNMFEHGRGFPQFNIQLGNTISILTEAGEEVPEKVEYSEETTECVDIGLKEYAILSTGEKIEKLRYLKKSEQRLKVHENG